MCRSTTVILWLIFTFVVDGFASSPPPGSPKDSLRSVIKTDVVTISVRQQYEKVRPGNKSALAVHFELAENWHFYASAKTAPGGMNLKIKPTAKDSISFFKAIFPQPHLYLDKSLGKKLEVFSDKFTVFLPFSAHNLLPDSVEGSSVDIEISIEGAVCSGVQCRMPNFGALRTEIEIDSNAAMDKPVFTLPEGTARGQPVETTTFGWGFSSAWGALLLAFLAGLSLNIMPCIWPVLPLVVMRLVQQAKQGKGKTVTSGLAFCCGILLFFACLAAANIILQLFYGTVLQWGDQFRSPGFVAGMALLLLVLALFMFDVFTITMPSSISGKSGSGTGYTGTVGMGFLAAVLSTPCSFAILAAAFAWAQTQPLPLATVTIMVIGVGMAVPYAILTSMPGLLKHIPKPGRWMEIFKQAVGFILLGIAVWLITALPQARRAGVLYFAVVLGFCVWMWSKWVDYNTTLSRKWLIRVLAVALAVAAGALFLPAPAGELIDWQPYDADLIEKAIAEERPVLIKFTANWCLSCEVVEKRVYGRADIAELIEQKGVLVIKADTTVKDYPATLALKNVYNEPGVPVSILFVPGRKEPIRWRDKSFADELKILLEGLASK
jgi:thiol:disulfide interchange protein